MVMLEQPDLVTDPPDHAGTAVRVRTARPGSPENGGGASEPRDRPARAGNRHAGVWPPAGETARTRGPGAARRAARRRQNRAGQGNRRRPWGDRPGQLAQRSSSPRSTEADPWAGAGIPWCTPMPTASPGHLDELDDLDLDTSWWTPPSSSNGASTSPIASPPTTCLIRLAQQPDDSRIATVIPPRRLENPPHPGGLNRRVCQMRAGDL